MSTRKQSSKLQWGKILLLTLIAVPLLWTLFLYTVGASWQGQSHLGIRNLWALRQTDRVETFRLNPHDFSNTKPQIGRYAVTGKGSDLSPAKASQLTSALVQAANTDDPFLEKACAPMPGVNFRLWQGQSSIDVAVCYECNIFIVTNANKKAFVDFDPQRAQLVKLAKEAFPKDKEIQKLNESK